MDPNSMGVMMYEQPAKDGSDRDKMAASIRNVLVSISIQTYLNHFIFKRFILNFIFSLSNMTQSLEFIKNSIR